METPKEVMDWAGKVGDAMHEAMGAVLLEADLADSTKIAASIIAVAGLFSSVVRLGTDPKSPAADDEAMRTFLVGVVDTMVTPAIKALTENVKNGGGNNDFALSSVRA